MARSALTGTRIRERRTALRIKQADLARSVGISPAYLNLIEHNRRRVGDELLGQIAGAMSVDPVALSEGAEGALFDGLREAVAGAEAEGGAHMAGMPELERIEEFVGRFPGWAAILAGRQARVNALERVVESYSERMAQDPFLLASLHEVLSAVTSLRSTAAILVETDDIEPIWRARFLRTIQEESLRLSETAEALVGYLDDLEEAETGLSSPLEQVEAWLSARNWHLEELEEATPPPPEALIAGVAELASSAARKLAIAHIERAQADARALPLEAFRDAVAELGMDPALLATRFGAPLGAVFRRLATLPVAEGAQPVGLVICDGSGALTFRRGVPGFALPRFGAACPLWPLYEALARPMQPVRKVVDMAGRLPERFLTYAICQPSQPGGFDGPVLMEAMMLILPPPPERAPGERAIGSSCRICPRGECAGRREPSILSEA
ncbi:short-chain fatty acyl-CoA regulator family protein [Sedimentimonas flavescens]|uniref:Short-chain fatty acyl-CoA regulator family protein n=1 Tax=Sedimentimonas flavescens TaxID=2851012 RepID=A0ABT2ZWK3_9RHOB|nr:short-chain fatty acyl-CoA regulator family protein [Sedimentimonas flavescens]MCV2878126.1 short-chain fatty acyl-CoA regulator family protein [Sedimentimonas flavescens]